LKKPAISIASYYYLGVSLIGLGLLAILTLHSPSAAESPPMQKQLTGLIFGVICVLGMMAGLSPSKCSRMLHFKTSKSRSPGEIEQTSSEEPRLALKGHHPTCGRFSSHVFSYGGKIYCAGCMGLVAGAVVAIVGDFVYFFVGTDVAGVGALVFWLGFGGVALGLLQYNFFIDRSDAHFLVNVIFVVGAFGLLVGANESSGNLVLNLYLLTLIIFWIATRVVLSQVEHRKMCSGCDLRPCSLSFD
jgi:hypothetical protein